MLSLSELKPILKEMLAEDGLGPAIKRLKAALPPDSKAFNDLVLLEAELKEANLKRIRGSLSETELDIKYNSLRERFLDFLNALDQRDLEASPTGKKAKQGSLLYQIPGAMTVHKETRCLVRIAYDEATLIENIELTRDTRIKDVRIAEVMEVELIDPAEQPAFAIRSYNRQEQFVEKDDYTEWTFYVKPLREGQFPLLLRVSVIEKVGDKERVRDIVLEETVVIVADPVAEAAPAGFKSSGYVVGEAAETPAAPAPSRRTPMQMVAWSLALLIGFSGMAYAAVPAVRLNVDWTFATVIDSREAYQNFADKHKGTAKAGKALEKVEDIDWEAVQETPSVQDIEKFLELHPDGRHNWEAVELLATLPLPAALQSTTIAVLQQYVAARPAAPAVNKVQEILQTVKTAEESTTPINTATDSKTSDPADKNNSAVATDADMSSTQQKTSSATGTTTPATDPRPAEYDMREPAVKEAEKTTPPVTEPAKTETSQPASAKASTGETDNSQSTTEGELSDPLKKLERDMVRVAAGSFIRGCKDATRDGDCYDSEKPRREVQVPAFSIGRYEVTQAQWRAVMGSDPSNFKNCDECPVEQVSWNDIREFLTKLNNLTGKRYRLPTEAEWEYAARGGSKTKDYLYSGSKNLDEVGWYDDNSGYKTHPVGRKKANELGLYDMSGNVWEWCEDDWHDNYNGAPTDGRAWVDSSRGSYRVDRGGSWFLTARRCRAAFRNDGTPAFRDDNLGFRLAL